MRPICLAARLLQVCGVGGPSHRRGEPDNRPGAVRSASGRALLRPARKHYLHLQIQRERHVECNTYFLVEAGPRPPAQISQWGICRVRQGKPATDISECLPAYFETYVQWMPATASPPATGRTFKVGNNRHRGQISKMVSLAYTLEPGASQVGITPSRTCRWAALSIRI